MTARTPSEATLPRWDMDSIFPGVKSAPYLSAIESLVASLDRWEGLLSSDAPNSATQLEDLLQAENTCRETFELLFSYTDCVATADTRDESAAAAVSDLESLGVRFSQLSAQATAWIGGLDPSGLELGPIAQAHRFHLERVQFLAKRLMSPAEESLAAALYPSGPGGWAKLHSNFTSQIEVEVTLRGETQTLPMSAVRNLASDADRAVRAEAYKAELAAWKRHETPIAASMNGVKGALGYLSKRRGWESPLDEACFHSNIDRPTLDAMMEAAREAFPIFRRYLHAKAKMLGLSRCAFYDLFAPLADEESAWPWDKAREFVVDQFGEYSEKMGDFARRAFEDRWIDAGPRAGKVGGAYCAPMGGDVSRILMNYKPSFDAVRTLAHELGHGYHNLCLDGRTALQRETPMTLAETASIFCETLVKEAVLASGTAGEKKVVLESSLQGATQVVVDITSRFLFEKGVFERREDRELSAREFCELMLEAQRETYGDGLDADLLHPYMWAAKPHYYGAGFYNFPYMFGLLFGLGLAEVRNGDPDGFKARYDDLLSQTGLHDAATLGAQFGIDIRSIEFWRGSLAQIERDVSAFEALP